MLHIIKFGLCLAFLIMAVGGGVGSWQFTLGALRSLVAKPTAQVTFATKNCSSTKLYWCIIITLVGHGNRNSNRPLTTTLFINDVSVCKCRTDLLSHLQS